MKRILLFLLLLSCGMAAAQRIPSRGHDLYGAVRDDEGRPVAGVVVSDGFTCCETDRRGVYRLDRNPDAAFVFYSVPSEYAVNAETGNPVFYERLDADGQRYDFTLKRLPEGAELAFRLFCLADPQCQTERHIERFRSETVPDVKRVSQERDVPSYGVTLGDVAYSSDKVNAEWIMERMRRAMDKYTPAAISAGAVPCASSPMISVSAKTAHMLEMDTGLPAAAACSSPSPAAPTPSAMPCWLT